MKNFIVIALSALTLMSTAFADQEATLTCKGEYVTLAVKSPYLGENSPATQRLYVLSTTGNQNEVSYTAYFLDVEFDVGPGGTIYITGKNEVGGSFQLITNFPTNVSDGTVVREISEGTLTYDHGPLKGEVRVSCVTE